MNERCYSELAKLKTFDERFNYLMLSTGRVGEDTFGFERYLNQVFYKSPRWKEVRRRVIIRDMGCDLGIEGHEIQFKAIVHHMNILTKEDILGQSPHLLNEEYLITVSLDTHNAIHYGNSKSIHINDVIERTPNDTCPWRKKREGR